MTAETFYNEIKRLIAMEPKPAAHILNSENCDYGEHIYYSKNLYFAFDSLKCVDSSYIYDSVMATNCMDCDYTKESELCYDSVDAHKCYNANFLENCTNVQESSYAYACIDCHDVFGCVLLRNKSFCIFNRQLSEGEYQQQIQKYKAWPKEKVLAMMEELKLRYPRTQTYESHNENSSYGNYVYYCKNCYLSFDTSYSTDCAYSYDSLHNKSTYDISYSTENELCYEVTDSGQNFNCDYVVYSAHCQDSTFAINCFDVKNSLGCVGLSHKQYCILNRQFTKEEYDRISQQILAELKAKNWGWEDIIY